MHLVLSTPYSVGDLAPGVTYPHVYVTTFYVNGPAATVAVTYEVGSFDNDAGTWTRAQYVPTLNMQFNGDELAPFFLSLPTDTTTPLWNQVEAIIYAQIAVQDPRMQGTVN